MKPDTYGRHEKVVLSGRSWTLLSYDSEAQVAVPAPLIDAPACSNLWLSVVGVSGAIYMNSDSVLNVDGAIGFVNNAAGSYGGEH